MLLKLSVTSAGIEFQIVGGGEGVTESVTAKKSWPQHHEADNGCWSGGEIYLHLLQF